MPLTVYLHPFSSYSQKAITALYEKDVPFEARILDGQGPVASEFASLWPVGRFPVATQDGRLIFEATGIIEHLDTLHPDGPRLIPEDPVEATEVRMWDRFFDNYVNYPQQRLVFGAGGRDAPSDGGASFRADLETAFDILERRMAEREWAAGGGFSMADCAAAPALFYVDWTHPIPERFIHVRAYRARLLARPSFARAVEEARPHRHLFPLPVPAGRD